MTITARAADGTDVRAIDEGHGPVILVIHPGLDDGRSWGKVAAQLSPRFSPSTFAGAVLFEPPVATGLPDPSRSAALAMANAAVADGKPGKAAQIFIRDIVGMPAFSARMLRLVVPVLPRLRVLIPRQIRDLDGVGLRLDAYAEITTPAVLLGGERSPAHLAQSLDALATVMPHAERVTLPRRDHFANRKAPAEVARVIEALARQVLH